MAEDISPATVDATTRDVKVDALVPWSATVIRYRSNARAVTGPWSRPNIAR